MTRRPPVVFAALLLGCAGDPAAPTAGKSALEASIEAAIGARVGAPVVARCMWRLPTCIAHLPDGAALAIRVADTGSGWSWRVDGMLVAASPIEVYVRASLDDLGIAAGAVHCGPALRRARPDDRVECRLPTGGMAWVTVHADGSTALELAIDPAAAAARGELVEPARELELSRQSRALEPADETDDN